MKPTGRTVLADPELVEFFADEPELLAIADAIASTTPRLTDERASRASRQRRFARPTLLSAAIAVAAAVALVLVSPWQRSQGTLSDLALAALGSGPVVHVVTETATGAGVVDIATSKATPVMQQDEIWYDSTLGLRRDLTRYDGTVVEDELDTPQGGFTTHGIVVDCTWIAAHPIAATKAHVSCNQSGVNGTKSRVVPRPKPTLDPGLTGFADSYREALASGQARQDGTGTVDGEPVDWLLFQTSNGGTERVAVNESSHKPLLLEGPHLRVRIDSIETIPYKAANFARPTPAETPVLPSTTYADGPNVELNASAIASAYPNGLWAGSNVAALSLVRAVQQTLTAKFADGTPEQTGRGLELDYGTLDSNGRFDATKPYLKVQEAPSSTLATMAGFIHGNFPPAGTLYVNPLTGGSLATAPGGTSTIGIGATRIDSVYVIIQTAGTASTTLLSVARALTKP
jgi:hypothetical protein